MGTPVPLSRAQGISISYSFILMWPEVLGSCLWSR